jgi:hypothetical protein
MEELGRSERVREVDSARRLTETGFEEVKGAEGAKGGAGMVIGK